ncbi:MAG: Asp23/Gls24 family envelope stress response protein [Lachnospiraceae bacterium]|nr:Asp23/Gls24 family envelope stress response protein [Lachnospiraceae bacterium]
MEEVYTMDTNNITISKDVRNIGSVQIADDVVAMIASLAATEIDGVSALVGNITNELMSKVGMKKLTKGVKVDIIENVVTIDLAIILEYGFNIPKTCQKVQDKVKTAIETMTGLTVSDVNIRISSVSMPKGK